MGVSLFWQSTFQMGGRELRKKLLGALILALLLGGCTPYAEETNRPSPTPALSISTPTPEAEPTPAPTPLPDPTEESLTVAYLSRQHQGRVYTAAEAPGKPEENDLRIDGLTYLGEEVIYETIGVAYALNVSYYRGSRNEAGEWTLAWVAGEPSCLVLERSGYDGAWQGVLGETRIDGQELSDVILEAAWGLMDIEVSLSIDGSPQRVGPGSAPNFHFAGEETAAAVPADYEPLYAEGDEWRSYTYPNFEALCYYNAAEDRTVVSHIWTGRSDVQTYRGVRIGESRERVLEAYPEGLVDTYWDYEGDYLCYCKSEISQFGPALLFWFEDDAVVKLELVNAID